VGLCAPASAPADRGGLRWQLLPYIEHHHHPADLLCSLPIKGPLSLGGLPH